MLPKVMARVGHVCWHAVRMSPSRTDRFSSRAWSLPATMRWMHIVHFSITPSCRTVTSGLSWTSSGSGHSVVPVEPPHVVRTVVAAVARAHTPVVDLPVQAFVGPIRGEDGADGLARRNFAVLTEHRQKRVLRMLGRALGPALDANPVELATVRRLRLADDGDVVLGLARRHARRASDAEIRVDHHAPAIPRVLLV